MVLVIVPGRDVEPTKKAGNSHSRETTITKIFLVERREI
jgi:hypothetical protein